MEAIKLTCAALPLNAENTACALVMGTREGMKSLMGSHTERLIKRVEAADWAIKPELQCIIGDESAQLTGSDEGRDAPASFPGMVTRVLHLRFRSGLSGLAVLPCAPLENNGAHLFEAVLACALHWQLGAAFLRWLVDENRFYDTMTDCDQWLIEADEAATLPLPMNSEAIRCVQSLTPYRRRRAWMLGTASVLVSAFAVLSGQNTLGEAMRDADIRPFLGKVLTEELLPELELPREECLRYAARVCAYLENVCGQEAMPALCDRLIARFMAGPLPALHAIEKRHGTLPPGLTYVLSGVIMLFAGVRNEGGAFSLLTPAGVYPALEEDCVLAAFSRMSCDMPPESLSYAALSDTDIWGCDLREIPGLEDAVTDCLRDLQLLGVQACLRGLA